jgi:hypothetical protein
MSEAFLCGLGVVDAPGFKAHFQPKYAAATNRMAIIQATITGRGFMVFSYSIVVSVDRAHNDFPRPSL